MKATTVAKLRSCVINHAIYLHDSTKRQMRKWILITLEINVIMGEILSVLEDRPKGKCSEGTKISPDCRKLVCEEITTSIIQRLQPLLFLFEKCTLSISVNSRINFYNAT